VLRDVSIQIPSGTVAALVGPSGAGKSTFANLIPRFYDVTGGAIRIGGIDLRDFSKTDLRNHISIVSQDTFLFNDTIRNNIRLGRMDATDDEVEIAAEHAFAHEFIQTFDNGYDTLVGERGTRLSGGQKQRIAIARAFLRNAPILILDEATSALDSESEEKVQKALVELVKGRTVFIIAHRFSTIKLASRILVFEQGILRGAGTHSELYASDALYKSLYDRQFIE
jgi:subfamily B ATP-binding cassette protein MsbA